jgi:RNA polymerase sigma factor (sigma-70 family)
MAVPASQVDSSSAVPVSDARSEGSGIAQTLAQNREEFLEFLARRVGSRELAEELLQDAFVNGLAHAGSVRDEESAVAWFYRLLRNRLVDHYRAAARERARTESDETLAETASADEDRDLHNQVCACVGRTLDAVSPAYAAVLRAVDLEGEALEGFAHREGIGIGNARVRLHRARRSMRERLEAMCGANQAAAFVNCDCGPAC